MSRFNLPCVIFAGGKSSRMGSDKSLLPFGGESSLTRYQYKRLRALFSNVYISCKTGEKFDFDADFILDPQETFAPTAGFVALFDALPDEKVFVLSVDTPFVGALEIQALLDADTPEADAVIAVTPEGSHPMCGIYGRALAPKFREMLACDNHKLGMLLKEARTQWVAFDSEAPFANLNHPHEYEAALKMAPRS